MKVTVFGACFGLLFISEVSGLNSKCFTAAVYEAVTVGGHFTCARQEICESLKVYRNVISEAARNGAQIIVTPEHGIFPPYERNKTHQYLEVIPSKMKRVSPCDEKQKFSKRPIQLALSCAAKENHIFVVANMGEVEYCHRWERNCPNDGRRQYNAVVVFDDNGYLIAKYRKYHLYYEDDHFDYPKQQEFTYFDTPFGRFGVFVCFDSLFKDPAIGLIEKHNVTTLALPTWWFNEMPFLVGHEYQQSLAIGNNVNLLAANAEDPLLGTSGSGIYNGRNGAIAYTYEDKRRAATLLVSTLSIDPRDMSAECTPNTQEIPIDVLKYASELSDTSSEVDKYKVPPLDVTILERIKLNESRDTIKLCKDEFCCELSYVVSENALKSGHYYYFGVGSGLRAKWCEEMCSLYTYDSLKNTFAQSEGSEFKYFRLTATFSTKYIYPSVMTNNLELVPASKWTFSKIGDSAMLEMRHSVSLISSGLYARCYHKDPPFIDVA